MPTRNTENGARCNSVKGTLSFQKCVESWVQSAYSYKDFFSKNKKKALRETIVASNGFEPPSDRMNLCAFKWSVFSDSKE